MNPLTPSKNTTILPVLAALTLVCFALSPRAQAACQNGCLGNRNTALGDDALINVTSGINNTAVGNGALKANRDGEGNTATGRLALSSNTSGRSNTATGLAALRDNTTGNGNTATGRDSLLFNAIGNENTATGLSALRDNTTGSQNTATGFIALLRNTTGSFNSAIGAGALSSNTTGMQNTATGTNALLSNTTGDNNTAIGFGTLTSNTTGRNNTAIGFRAGANSTTGENNIYIGGNMFGVPGESNHTYVRNVNITSISGGGADTVTVDLGTGLIGHLSSSRRYKQNIKPMDNTSETLYRLRPVTFRYKKEIDRTQSPAFGLIAEEVAQVNPALVAHDANGQPESVHYEMVNAMLLNEFLKEHRKNEEQQATIAQLKSGIEALTATVKEQASQIQKVNAELQLQKAAPQTVLND